MAIMKCLTSKVPVGKPFKNKQFLNILISIIFITHLNCQFKFLLATLGLYHFVFILKFYNFMIKQNIFVEYLIDFD